MTRTEERLADALGASARRVRDDRLRPLTEPDLNPGSGRGAWPRRLAPFAAAVAVVLAIGLAVSITGSVRNAPRSIAPADRGTSLPKYNVNFSAALLNGGVTVYSTSTGKAVTTAPCPFPLREEAVNVAVAAAPGDRAFYVEYNVRTQIFIYTFSLSDQGEATPMRLIRGGDFSGTAGLGSGGSLVVSPDGTQLGLTVDTTVDLDSGGDYGDQIVVIDLKTGQHNVWQGGLHRSGKVFSIPDLSFTADGQSLVFLAQWCDPPAAMNPCLGSAKYPRSAQVRVLGVHGRGGSLSGSRTVLAQSARYPVIAQALAGPDGSDLTVLVLSGPYQSTGVGTWEHLSIDHVQMGSGALLGVDYQTVHTTLPEGQPQTLWLGSDPSNRLLLLTWDVGRGYIEAGVFHSIPHPVAGW